MHPDVMSEAADIIAAAIARMNRASKVPVYVCVRSYHRWLNDVMNALNFEAWVEQAVMVKQIAAGIRHPGFAKIQVHGTVETTPATRYYWSLIWHDCHNHEENEKHE
jgi:hypothetical protein